ncbi:MAG: M48 family metallopeptidase [Deltaproteobacteria bacterium]|nr:M48 family metallopeptidase [Deltaproteobacteria bacterium]
MADNESRLPPGCVDEAQLARTQEETQLEFAFLAAYPRLSGCGPIPGFSQQALRPWTSGRCLLSSQPHRSPEELALEREVSCHLPPGKVLHLQLTENRYTIISVRRGRECYRVRVHRMFAGAEARLVRALARYVVHNDQRSSTLLSEFIEKHQDQIRRKPSAARRPVLRTRGRVYDLRAVLDRLNARYFDGKLDLRITWGTARRRQPQRSIKVGTYLVEDRLIRVHPVLDQAHVPRYFLDWIVFHEMLHGKHAIRRVGGRRCFHPPAFAREEKQFPDYGRARLWEKANLDRLLSWEP